MAVRNKREDHLTLITIRDHQRPRRILEWTIQSQKEIQSKREQLKTNESPHLHFSSFSLSLFLPLFLRPPLTICVCPSIYLPVHLYLSRFLRLPFRGLSDLCIVPQSRYPGAHTGARVQVHVRECLCVYTSRRDPSLVRSHFKHLLYHDHRSLGARPVRAFLARGPPS